VQAVGAQLSSLPSRSPEAPRSRSPHDRPRARTDRGVAHSRFRLLVVGGPRSDRAYFSTAFREKPGGAGRNCCREYQARLSADLLARLHGLAAIASPEPVTPADLTPALVGRFISPHGKWLMQIYPKSQIWDIKPLEKFIADVRSVDPEATGTPLQTYEASKAIKHSYETAGIYALVAVCLFLLIDFRNLRDCLLHFCRRWLGRP